VGAKLTSIALDSGVDIESLRARLQKMSDNDLVQFGKDCAFLCSPKQNFGKPPLEVWATQLKEARREWRRRHPAK
jgi:hypothetical protein